MSTRRPRIKSAIVKPVKRKQSAAQKIPPEAEMSVKNEMEIIATSLPSLATEPLGLGLLQQRSPVHSESIPPQNNTPKPNMSTINEDADIFMEESDSGQKRKPVKRKLSAAQKIPSEAEMSEKNEMEIIATSLPSLTTQPLGLGLLQQGSPVHSESIPPQNNTPKLNMSIINEDADIFMEESDSGQNGIYINALSAPQRGPKQKNVVDEQTLLNIPATLAPLVTQGKHGETILNEQSSLNTNFDSLDTPATPASKVKIGSNGKTVLNQQSLLKPNLDIPATPAPQVKPGLSLKYLIENSVNRKLDSHNFPVTPVPQVKLGANVEIVLDEQSLVNKKLDISATPTPQVKLGANEKIPLEEQSMVNKNLDISATPTPQVELGANGETVLYELSLDSNLALLNIPATPAPKMKLGANGEILLDEQNLVKTNIASVNIPSTSAPQMKLGPSIKSIIENSVSRKLGSHNFPVTPVPQVKLGANGEIVLDEQSLVIEEPDEIESDTELPLIFEDESVPSTSKIGSRATRSKGWSKRETLQFYKCLNTIGSDFEAMTTFFPGRTRRNIKNKFKIEEKRNPKLIDKALLDHLDFDTTELEKEARKEKEAIERKKEKALKKHEHVQKSVEIKPKKSYRRISIGMKTLNMDFSTYEIEPDERPRKSQLNFSNYDNEVRPSPEFIRRVMPYINHYSNKRTTKSTDADKVTQKPMESSSIHTEDKDQQDEPTSTEVIKE